MLIYGMLIGWNILILGAVCAADHGNISIYMPSRKQYGVRQTDIQIFGLKTLNVLI